MKRARLVALVAIFFASACYGPDSNVTDTGRGRPLVEATFPAGAPAGSEQQAVVSVENPGPGDIGLLYISFTLVGVAGQQELPQPLVLPGTKKKSPSVVDVEPAPDVISADGTIYGFGDIERGAFLPEGENTTVRFTLLLPEEEGLVANSVTAYDGSEPERARGVLVKTEVGGSGQ